MMNQKFLNNPLGVPIGTSNFKHGEGVAGVLGVAALAIGAFVNAMTTESTNSANQRINQQNINAAEQQQLEAERYNSPQNQRAMLEEAGYSPYSYLQQISSVGTTGVPSPVAMQRPDLGFDKMAQMLFDMPGMTANVEKTKSESDLLNVEGAIKKAQEQYESDRALWNMIEQKHKAEKAGFDKEVAYWQQKVDAFTFDEKVQNYYLQNEMLRHGIEKTVADTSVVTLNKLMAEKELAVKDKMLDNELRIQLQQIDTLAAQQGAYNAQAREAVEAALYNAAQRNKVGIEADRLKKAAKFYVDEQEQNAILRKWQALGAESQAGLTEARSQQEWNITRGEQDSWLYRQLRRAGKIINFGLSGTN